MNRGLRFLFVCSLFFSVKSFSQTLVSGKLTQNTTWTASLSPYMLTGDITVPPDVKLTIMPGVVVERTDKSQIAVSGTIIANGAVGDSIHFISNDLGDQTVAAFIEFSESDLSNSSLRFLSFQSANLQTKNIRIGSEKESSAQIKNSGTLFISRSNLSDGNVVSHGFNSAISMNIDSCYFDSSEIHSSGTYSEQINITNSVIENSTELADELSFGITNTACTISNSIVESGANSSISLATSIVTSSGFNVPDDATLSVTGCTIANSPVIGIPGGIVNINASKLSTDNADTSLYPKIGDISYLVTAFQANITNTTFSGIDNIDAVAIKGTGTDTTTVISRNTFTGFTDAVTVYNFSDDIHVDSNNFETIKTYDIINYSDRNFNAVYDYFQLGAGLTIPDVIYDHHDNPSYGLVNYIPFANDPVLPLHLVSFGGSYSNNVITLAWQTANEINSSKFVVQHLVNGIYEDAGTVAAKGGAANSYLFSTASVNDGANIYRLKIIDKDGTYTYSSSVSISVTSLGIALTIYPNPAAQYVLISHEKTNANTQLQLVDMSGKIVKSILVSKDDVQNKINVDGVAKGTYKIIWHNGTSIQSKTVLIQ